MATKIDYQAAYVLHGRPYRETSMLVDFLTLEYGKVTAVVRGVRRSTSKWKALVQPFVPVHISWQGRQELKTIRQLEAVGAAVLLKGDALFCGLYLNELLEKSLQSFDPHPELYAYYQYTITELSLAEDIEGALRTFEHRLLADAGYLPMLAGKVAERQYLLNKGDEFVELCHDDKVDISRCFYGWQLAAIAADDYTKYSVRRAAKRLMRLLIEHMLAGKTLRSRALFRKN